MERITISLDDALAKKFDELIRGMGYVNRSEAVRDILREHISSKKTYNEGDCVAALSYVTTITSLDWPSD
ncbi:MAG: ribbon-helix-helix protein, CopG family [Nitrosomonadales bacterium]